MSTRKQVRANRANSKFSTGPSKESLDHTRYNGLTHGLRSGTLILPNEDPQRFRQLHEGLDRERAAARSGGTSTGVSYRARPAHARTSRACH